jgi:hypothetical protein
MFHFASMSVHPCLGMMCTQLLKIDFRLFVHAFSTTTIWLYTSSRLFLSQADWIENGLRCLRLFETSVMYSYHKRYKRKILVVLDSYHKRSERRNVCGARFVSQAVLNQTRL